MMQGMEVVRIDDGTFCANGCFQRVLGQMSAVHAWLGLLSILKLCLKVFDSMLLSEPTVL
eukprot:4183774-Amphidinium_carterae.1